jgi:hypothetical protein
MLIPNKHSGYQAGIRLYPGGGGGGSGISVPGTGDSQIGNTGGTTPVGTGVAIPPVVQQQPQAQRGFLGSVGGGGRTYFQQRPDVATAFNQNSQGMSPTEFAQQHFQQFGQFEGNVSDPSRQFYQPVYQPQYQDYNMGNRMGVSQFGQGMGGFNPYAMQMQTPFNPYTNSFQPQMGMGMQTPFSSGMSRPRQQPIVTRSAQVRGTPNVMMRRAEGGIASLVDDE